MASLDQWFSAIDTLDGHLTVAGQDLLLLLGALIEALPPAQQQQVQALYEAKQAQLALGSQD